VPEHVRINVHDITPRTAPPYIRVTHAERMGPDVLSGSGSLLLVGPLGVNYYIERADSDSVYLRRFDMPSSTGHKSVTIKDRAGAWSFIRT
jgi:hypothetical protein